MTETQPSRIEPVYEIPEKYRAIELLQAEEAELYQGKKKISGSLKVIQQWTPLKVHFEIESNNSDEIGNGEARVESNSLDASIFAVKKHGRIHGYPRGKVSVRIPEKLNKVTFHLPNYPDLYGENIYPPITNEASIIINPQWSEVMLQAEGWQIRLQPHKKIKTQTDQVLCDGLNVLSGLGEIKQIEGKEFTVEEVLPLLDALKIFLSFAFNRWSPPMLVVGSNDNAQKAWELWANYNVVPQWNLKSWITRHNGEYLADAFPGFLKLWRNENWREPLELAVHWLIEASSHSANIEGAIAYGQIPLEMLSWMVFVDENSIVNQKEFDRLSAASQLQLLLSHCEIPFEIPKELKNLHKISKGTEIKTGPQIATTLRNTIIHPNKKNREILRKWESTFRFRANDLRWEVQQLFQSYVTLVFLKLIGYEGQYVDRISPVKIGKDNKYVPWVEPSTGDDETEAF